MFKTTWGGSALDKSESHKGPTTSVFPESGGTFGSIHASLEPSALARTPDLGRKLDICGFVNTRVEVSFARVDEQKLLFSGSQPPVGRRLAERMLVSLPVGVGA